MTDPSDAYEIFLSYARVDNERETEDEAERGWVDHFQLHLLKQLRRRGRADVGFWRDVAEISAADRFAPEIIKGLAEAYFFLPIISPTYIQRPWCREELNKVSGRRAQEPTIDQRVVPVYKLSPLEPQRLPELIRGRGGYHFYEHDPVTKRVKEYYRYGQVKNERAYADLLDQIADYICSNLPAVAAYPEIVNPPAAADVVTVFVANVADDMFTAYGKLVTELKSQGFRVVIDPERELPQDPGAAVVAVDEAMQQAQLVVHLLGDDAGPRVGGARLVDRLLDQTRAGPVPRLIWAPAALFSDPTSPKAAVRNRDRDAFETFEKFGDYRDGDSVSDAPFEAFLQDLVRRCHQLRSPISPAPAGGAAESPSVYVVGADDDASLVHKVTGTLIEEHGLNAYPCSYQGSPHEIRRLHEEEMRDSDAVLYCWGRASDTWLRSYTREVRFAARFGRENPFRATAVVVGPPCSDYKQNFRSADVSLQLGQGEAITAELFTPLVAALGTTMTRPLAARQAETAS